MQTTPHRSLFSPKSQISTLSGLRGVSGTSDWSEEKKEKKKKTSVSIGIIGCDQMKVEP